MTTTSENTPSEFELQATELTQAFENADRWVEEKRRRDPMSGFGRGAEWGQHVLQNFMPPWFQNWMKTANWHSVGLCQGEDGWWTYVNAFELTKKQWWKQVSAYF